MFVDESIRRISLERLELALGKALEELTGKPHEVHIHNLHVPPGSQGSMVLKFGRVDDTPAASTTPRKRPGAEPPDGNTPIQSALQ